MVSLSLLRNNLHLNVHLAPSFHLPGPLIAASSPPSPRPPLE